MHLRFAAFLLALTGVPALSAEHFVATIGDDASPGTEAQPWRTIQRAADAVQPGDVVSIAAGTYQEQVTITRSGTPGRRITFRGEAVIDGEGLPVDDHEALVDVKWARDITLEGLIVRNSPQHGIRAVDSPRLELRACEVDGSGHSGMFITGCEERSDTLIEKCSVHDSRTAGIAIWDNPGGFFTISANEVYRNLGVSNWDGIEIIDTPYVAVLRNTVYDNAPEEGQPEGDQIDAGGTNDLTSPSHHIIYEGNRVYGRGGGVKMNNEPLHSIIRRNHILDTGLVFYEGPTKIAVCHNTVIGAVHALQVWGNGESENFGGTQVRNNIFADSTSYAVNIGNRAIPTTDSMALDHSLYRFAEGNHRGINVNAPDFDATFAPSTDGLKQFTDRTGRETHATVTTDADLDNAAIDIGGPLTTVVEQIDARTIVVECSWFFHDSWDGLLEPDTVRVGSAEVVVSAVDYESHRITLADDVDAPAGTPVSLPFTGNAPDCGHQEHGAD